LKRRDQKSAKGIGLPSLPLYKRNAAPATKNGFSEKKHKNRSLNMCRVPIYFGIRKKESGVLCCGVLLPSDAPEIESDKSFPFRGLCACGGEAFLYACGAGTAGYQPDCTKRIAQN
jgi:hypothetical protein